MRVADVRQLFIDKLAREEFTTGRGGHKMLEVIGASFTADEEAIFGTVNREYVEDELAWYESMSSNIYDIREDGDAPAAWKSTANVHGEINSNYGLLIWGKQYHEQFWNVLTELNRNPDTRRATMVYTRPSIWVDYNENGKNDFICTNAVTYYLRGNKLHAVVQMRSNDVVFGFKNDRAWQQYVLERLVQLLNAHVSARKDRRERGLTEVLPDDIVSGDIIWQVQNLHVYSRHFHLVK